MKIGMYKTLELHWGTAFNSQNMCIGSITRAHDQRSEVRTGHIVKVHVLARNVSF